MSKNSSKAARDNRANQLNPQHTAFHRARGHDASDAQYEARHQKSVLDNSSKQTNPQSTDSTDS